MTERTYLSIGEVLAILLDEFPDITISKIRFLESQGLIDPERTSSGYRKFTEPEVERLRLILREQKKNFLPLKVIKDRLEDETSELHRELSAVADEESVRAHPSSRTSLPRPQTPAPPASTFAQVNSTFEDEQRSIAQAHADRTESLARDELVAQFHVSDDFLRSLESAGLVGGHEVGDTTFFDNTSVTIARIAQRFQEIGIDLRHLRAWKLAADKEVTLFEQRMLPLLRQRNPESKTEALHMLDELVSLGGQLRNALMAREIRRLTEGR